MNAINTKLILKRILLSCLIVIVLSMSIVPSKKADAFLPVIPIGALMLWGGAALVAGTATAVGLDPGLAADLEEWGKQAWDGASAAVKQSMEWTLQYIAWEPIPTYNYSTAELKWTPEVQTYLKTSFTEYFITGSQRPKMAFDYNNILKTATTLDTYRKVEASEIHHYTLFGEYLLNGNWVALKRVEVIGSPGNYHISMRYNRWSAPPFPTKLSYGNFSHPLEWGPISNPSLDDAVKYLWRVGSLRSVSHTMPYDEMVFSTPVPANDYIVPGDIPVEFPDVITIPLPTGNATSTPDVYTPAMPAIGYPNGIRTADPRDIAIGNPAIPGTIPAELTPDQAITAPADIAAPVAVVPGNPAIPSPWTPTVPNMDWPDKLKAAVTTRFPFSIPWDIAYLVNIFVATPQVPVITVNTSLIKFSVTLNQLDPYMPWFRTFLIVAFLWGLALNTRKLLGGGK